MHSSVRIGMVMQPFPREVSVFSLFWRAISNHVSVNTGLNPEADVISRGFYLLLPASKLVYLFPPSPVELRLRHAPNLRTVSFAEGFARMHIES